MKLYVVFGVEYHVSRDLLGVYESKELAEKRESELAFAINYYDEIIIEEVELNQDLE